MTDVRDSWAVGATYENFMSREKGKNGEMTEESYRKLNEPDAEMPENAGGTIDAIPGSVQSPGSALDFLERTALDAQVSSDKIRTIASRVENQATYPSSQLGNSLKLVAKLIGGGLATRVFYVSQGGYDTHTNQLAAHERLLKELGDSVKAFVADLKAQGNLSRVLVMTFSEFGRRVVENASSGTDHDPRQLSRGCNRAQWPRRLARIRGELEFSRIEAVAGE